MGNELIAEEIATTMNRKKSKKSIKRFISSKLTKKYGERRNSNKADSFFVNYLQKKGGDSEIMDDITSFDQRRQVFVSLIGLFNTWTKMPSHVLYSAIFILPLKRKWIYDLVKYRNEYLAHDMIKLTLFQQNTEQTKLFIDMLRWKDSQGLIFWMMDDFRTDLSMDDTSKIAPFWQHVSAKLTTLYDPVTQENYKPITEDLAFWEKQFGENETAFKYETDASSIIPELQYLANMKYVAIQEIIFQSNPSSLNPIISYQNIVDDESTASDSSKTAVEGDKNTEPVDIKLGEGWWISDDYDPYDIESQEMCNVDDDE